MVLYEAVSFRPGSVHVYVGWKLSAIIFYVVDLLMRD